MPFAKITTERKYETDSLIQKNLGIETYKVKGSRHKKQACDLMTQLKDMETQYTYILLYCIHELFDADIKIIESVDSEELKKIIVYVDSDDSILWAFILEYLNLIKILSENEEYSDNKCMPKDTYMDYINSNGDNIKTVIMVVLINLFSDVKIIQGKSFSKNDMFIYNELDRLLCYVLLSKK